MKGKVGIICLANGPYSIFIPNLVQSCEEKFLLDYEKHYYVFSDTDFESEYRDKCTLILKERKGWPGDCLIRPEYSFEVNNLASDLDYVYFFNANMFVYSEVGEEILPDSSGLVGVEHPHYTHRNNLQFTYDRNPATRACIPAGEGLIYYQACMWGGTTEAFMKLSKEIKEWVDADLADGVEPIWLDESYLNRYFLNNQPKTLSPVFAWPTYMTVYDTSPTIKIIQLQKDDYLPKNFRYITE